MGHIKNVEIQRADWKDEAERLRAKVDKMKMEKEKLDGESNKLKRISPSEIHFL